MARCERAQARIITPERALCYGALHAPDRL
jgi:hypothetical protein